VKRIVLALLALLALALPVAAQASAPIQIRRVDLAKFPLVRVTAVVPDGSRPTLWEGTHLAKFVKTRDLGSAQAMLLAVDNSQSMTGRPLREAKRAAEQFLMGQRRTATTGLVVFAHEALALTRPDEAKTDVGRALESLAPDVQTGTSLYDAVKLSAARLQRMSNGTRILILLTDGRDLGSRSSLSQAIAAAQKANVVVYSIAAGTRADMEPLATLASATGGRLFDAADATSLGATYRTLSRELDRTWQLSYLSNARPGDRVEFTVRSARSSGTTARRIPADGDESSLLPASIAHSSIAAAFVIALAALLSGLAGAVALRRRRKSELSRLLKAYVKTTEREEDAKSQRARLEAVLEWTERSLDDVPGSKRLARELENSGLKLRVGYLPYLAGLASLIFGILGAIVAAPPAFVLLLMLVGFLLPLPALKIAAGNRTKAFDKQLPDVLATIASTLRAGHGLRMALKAIVDDGAPPASEELARVLGEEKLGRPLDEAIDAMCRRIGSPDLEYVATAINVQSQAGGSLAGLFDTLSETVRERQRHARKVRALSALGRMSAIVLVLMPIGLGALMTLLSPSYMKPLYTTSGGHILIVLCLTSMAIGSLFLKKIVSVRY
jgi:Flp pilus assembly protein TadB/predicted lactoylglutathione lyase